MRPFTILLPTVTIMILGLVLLQAYVPSTPLGSGPVPESLSTSVATIVGSGIATLSQFTGLPPFTPTGVTVTYSGTFRYGVADPKCATEARPCEMMSVQLYYVVLGSGDAYRLVFSSVPSLADGVKVKVTGVLVKPSSWNATAWVPAYYFIGDIYVQAITLA